MEVIDKAPGLSDGKIGTHPDCAHWTPVSISPGRSSEPGVDIRGQEFLQGGMPWPPTRSFLCTLKSLAKASTPGRELLRRLLFTSTTKLKA